MINELIAEYLSFAGYMDTLSVFAAETQTSTSTSGCSGGVDNRRSSLGEAFIRVELGLNDASSSLAMLYEVVEAMKARKRREYH